MSQKTILIIGSQGQDGTYLKQQVKNAGNVAICIDKDYMEGANSNFSYPDLTDLSDTEQMIQNILPDEIYYLAAFHRSSEEDNSAMSQIMEKSIMVHFTIPRNILAAIVEYSPLTKFFFASSSHIFGKPEYYPQNEDTPLAPLSPYAFTKMLGLQLCRFYRSKGIYAACGILYNHESPLRPPQFITRRIVKEAVQILRGERDTLVVGNLDSKVDWGYAPDYTDAMQQIVQLEKPDEFIIASGELHTVKEFVEEVFGILGLEWKEYIVEDRSLLKKEPNKGKHLCGDPSKLKTATGWQQRTSFSEMIKIMVGTELKND